MQKFVEKEIDALPKTEGVAAVIAAAAKAEASTAADGAAAEVKVDAAGAPAEVKVQGGSVGWECGC